MQVRKAVQCHAGNQGKDPSYKGAPYKPTVPCPKDKLNQSLLYRIWPLNLQERFSTPRNGSLLRLEIYEKLKLQQPDLVRGLHPPVGAC